jgi:formylglycine-generating enzyme required for sulfatase activity
VQAADRDWKPLLARAEAPGVEPERVREEVIDYLQRYARTPHAARAARLQQQLMKLPPLVNSIGMELVPIPPGKFLMGSPDEEPGRQVDEGPQHEVIITRPFYMAVHDVTVGQFKAFVKDKGYQTEAEKGDGAFRIIPGRPEEKDPQANWQNPGFEQADDHPVVCVSWNDAGAFCDWLSAKEGKKYALPTEAQWEYCCRAGSQTRFHFGNDDRELAQYAWYGGHSENRTHPVGGKKPNAWGLFDMNGNVWQWTFDTYAADYYGKSPKLDPPGPSTAGNRVFRGGAWNDELSFCRAARRYSAAPSIRTTHLGIRIILLR